MYYNKTPFLELISSYIERKREREFMMYIIYCQHKKIYEDKFPPVISKCFFKGVLNVIGLLGLMTWFFECEVVMGRVGFILM
jgi:hypothetical protein